MVGVDKPTGQEAREAWSSEAYSILVGVAQTYHAVITYKELAEEIQSRTGIRTRLFCPTGSVRFWAGWCAKPTAVAIPH